MTDQGIQTTYLLTEADTLRGLREITAEFPEFCYKDSVDYREVDRCRYANAVGAPSCLIGHLINRVLGPEAFELLRLQENFNGFTVSDHNWPVSIKFESPRLRGLLRLVQRKQDDGSTWGRILDEVLLTAGNLYLGDY